MNTFTQRIAGLSNNAAFGVSFAGDNIWVATAERACRLNLYANQRSLYNERNTPMAEIWVYAVFGAPTKVRCGFREAS